MPAPLGNAVTRKMPKIDVFGVEASAATRNAVRFFRERRIVVTYVDLAKHPLDAAELRAFLERLGPAGLLVDLPPAGVTDRGALLTQIRQNPALLRLPIVRHGTDLTSGPAEATWKAWLAKRRATRP